MINITYVADSKNFMEELVGLGEKAEGSTFRLTMSQTFIPKLKVFSNTQDNNSIR
jgi:hypothetical protein